MMWILSRPSKILFLFIKGAYSLKRDSATSDKCGVFINNRVTFYRPRYQSQLYSILESRTEKHILLSGIKFLKGCISQYTKLTNSPDHVAKLEVTSLTAK